MITESNELASALDDAAKIWPDARENRAELLRRLVYVGSEALSTAKTKQRATKLAAINKCAGSMNGVWPRNWRNELKAEWPE